MSTIHMQDTRALQNVPVPNTTSCVITRCGVAWNTYRPGETWTQTWATSNCPGCLAQREAGEADHQPPIFLGGIKRKKRTALIVPPYNAVTHEAFLNRP
jgi:hypothetical protein